MNAIKNRADLGNTDLPDNDRHTSNRYDNNPDDIWATISNSRRRTVIDVLDQRGTSTTGDLAEHIASIENDCDPDELNAIQRKRVYIGLYQEHLPGLAESGVTDWDDRRHDVSRGPHFAAARDVIETLDALDPRQPVEAGLTDRAVAALRGAVGHPTPTRTDGGNDALSIDTVTDVLSNERRRAVIRILSTDEAVDLMPLARHIASEECDTAPSKLDYQQVHRIYVSLYQTHLEKLDGLGVLKWDRDANTVQRGPAFIPTHRALEALTDALDPDVDRENARRLGLLGRLTAGLGGST